MIKHKGIIRDVLLLLLETFEIAKKKRKAPFICVEFDDLVILNDIPHYHSLIFHDYLDENLPPPHPEMGRMPNPPRWPKENIDDRINWIKEQLENL